MPDEPTVLEPVGEAGTEGDVDMTAAAQLEPQARDTGKKAKAAEAPAAEPLEPLFETPAGTRDDLKKISGVGPAIERKLNALGVTRFDQVAGFSDEDIAKIDDALNFKGRILRDDWIGQAKSLAGG